MEQIDPQPPTTDQAPSTFDPVSWVEAHGDALFRYARSRVGDINLAEDLVQETFLAALRGMDRFSKLSSGRTWLVAILRRKISDYFRSKSSDPPMMDATRSVSLKFFDAKGRWIQPPSPWPSAEKRFEDAEFLDVLNTCLDGLPPHLADPFILREREQMAPETVREVLGLTDSNLRVRIHRARLLLRACLEQNAFGV